MFYQGTSYQGTFANQRAHRFTDRPGAILLAGLLIACVLIGTMEPRVSAQTTANWTGGAGTTSYNDPDNWDTPVVPLNTLTEDFIVVIPNSQTVDFDVPGTGHEVFQLSQGSDGTLRINAGRDLAVVDQAVVRGVLTTDGGVFVANSPSSQLGGNAARILVGAVGQVVLGASTYDTQGTFTNNGSRTVLSAQQAGTVLDLSTVTEWNATFNDNQGSWTTVQKVEGLDGGLVDLSGLQTLILPERSEDRVDFVTGGGGSIDLSSLTTVSGTGQARFDVAASTTWTLPALASASDLTLNVQDGATFTTPLLTTLGDLTLTLNNGSTVNLPILETINGLSITWVDNNATLNAPQVTALINSLLSLETGRTVITAPLTNIDNSRLFVNNGLSYSVAATTYDSQANFTNNATRTIFSSQQAGTVLDLSNVQAWDATFNDNQGSWTTVQKVEALDGGLVDLSGLQTLLLPERSEDRVDFVTGVGGTIDLSSLTTVSGTGQARFDVAAGTTWTLPALASASDLTLNVQDGATFTTPLLTNLGDLTLTLNNGATVNLPDLETINGLSITWVDNNATLNAPQVTALLNSVLSLETGRTVITAPLTNIDNSQLFVNNGLSYSVAATTYDSQGNFTNNATRTIFSSQQAGTVLDLSNVQAWDATFNDNQGSWTTVQKVEALDGGLVDLSGLQTLLLPERSEDRVDFVTGGGGTIDLSSLTTVSGTGQARFDVAAGTTWTLPALASASDLTLNVQDGATFTTPLLTTLGDLTLTLNNGATVNLPILETINGLSITWVDNNATLNAPQVTALLNSVLSLETGRTVITAPLTNIDNSQLFVNNGLSYSVAATTYDSQGNFTNNATRTIFSSQQAGTVLDLSNVAEWDATFNDNQGSWTTVQKVEALDGGLVDLSGLQTLLLPERSEDRVDFVTGVGGTIDLSSLTTVSGTGQARFDVAAGTTWTLPALASASDLTLNVQDGATFTTPLLTTLGDLTLTLNNGATVNLPILETINGLSITWVDNNATLNAPQVTALLNSVLSLETGRTVITAPLTNIDNSQLFVNNGLSYSVAATTYDSQGNFSNNATRTIFSSQQAGTVLDLSNIAEWDASFNDNQNSWTTVQKVEAMDGGLVDLSGLETLFTPERSQDRVDFVASGGGVIDLSALTTISGIGQARLTVSNTGSIRLGSLMQAGNTQISVTDNDSVLDVAGDLALEAGTLSVGNGATVEIGGGFSFDYTNEASFMADAAIFHMDGAGAQRLEVGGEDGGVGGSTSGNFGIGQLIIGRTEQRSSVSLRDVIDNGNRGALGTEALYLYGLGGPDGLRINSNSALVLNGINVYAWDALTSQMVHLNAMFQPGDLRLPFDDGFLQLVPLDFQWTNNLGGDFNVATNWSDGLLPLPSDSALWNLGSVNGYTVQFGTNVATDSAIVKTDKVTFDLGGFTYSAPAQTATTGVIVGQDPGDQGQLSVTNGTLTATTIRIAAAAGSAGALNSGSGGILNASETLFFGGGDGLVSAESGGVVQALTIDLGTRGELSTVDGAILVGTGPVAGLPTGSYTQRTDGTLAITLDDPAAGFDATVDVAGDASLTGQLDISLATGYLPDLYTPVTIVSAGNLTGNFELIEGMSLSDTEAIAVTYSNTEVMLERSLLGDANRDGTIAQEDLDAVLLNWGSTMATWVTGDYNGDSLVAQSDLDAVLLNWGSTATGISTSAVPEPVNLGWLAGLAGLLGGWATLRGLDHNSGKCCRG